MQDFGISQNERIGLFIDGANLHGATRALGFDIDFSKLRKFFSDRGTLVRASYYTAMLPDDEEGHNQLRPLIDWLEYNGYKLFLKNAKEYTDAMGRQKIKGDCDVDLTVGMIEQSDHLDHIVLFSGDGDYIPAVEYLHRKGKKVTAISAPAMMSDELRRKVDSYISLIDLQKEIGRIRMDRIPGVIVEHRNRLRA